MAMPSVEVPSAASVARRDVAVVAGLVALELLALAVTASEGALGIPRNDDWSYTRALFGWQSSGHLVLTGFNEQTLVGQLLLARPLAALWPGSITALQLLTVAVAVLGIVVTYRLLRRLAGPLPCGVASLCLVGGPIFGALSTTYMADVYALTLATASLAAGAAAVAGDDGAERDGIRSGWLWAAVAAGFAAFSVRQVAVAAPLAVVAGAWLRCPPGPAGGRGRRAVLAGGAVLAVACGALYAWRAGLPNAGLRPVTTDGGDLGEVVRTTLQLGFDLGFLVLPAALVAGPVRVWRRAAAVDRRAAQVSVALPLVAVAGLVVTSGGELELFLRGSYLMRWGPLAKSPVLAGVPTAVVPPVVWWALQAAAVVGVITLAAASVVALDRLRSWWRAGRRRPIGGRAAVLVVLGAYSVLWGVLVVVGSLIARTPFDRYALPVVPVAALAVLLVGRSGAERAAVGARGGRNRGQGAAENAVDRGQGAAENAVDRGHGAAENAWRRVAVGAGVVAWVGLGLAYTAFSADFDAARWQLAERAVRETGADPLAVDGGMEWLGFHSSSPYALGSSDNVNWYATAFADVHACWLLGQGSAIPVDPAGPPVFDVVEGTLWVQRHYALFPVRCPSRP